MTFMVTQVELVHQLKKHNLKSLPGSYAILRNHAMKIQFMHQFQELMKNVTYMGLSSKVSWVIILLHGQHGLIQNRSNGNAGKHLKEKRKIKHKLNLLLKQKEYYVEKLRGRPILKTLKHKKKEQTTTIASKVTQTKGGLYRTSITTLTTMSKCRRLNKTRCKHNKKQNGRRNRQSKLSNT